MRLNDHKTLTPALLEILRRYSDENHRLSQKTIADLLYKHYGKTADRKTLSRNLKSLIDMGYDIEFSEKTRKSATGEQTVTTDFYINREFSESELRVIIDCLMFARLPYNTCKNMIEKLKNLASSHFAPKVRHITNLQPTSIENKQLFYTIDILSEAIHKNKQVAFNYNQYGKDKKLRPNVYSNGNIKTYTINPYQTIYSCGRYYLIGNLDKYDNISHWRIDKITDIQILDTASKKMKKVKGAERGLDLAKHFIEHIYMFSGESVTARFIADSFLIDDIVDWFGLGAKITDKGDDKIEVSVQVNETAMKFWCLQYGGYVELIEPLSLREKIADKVKIMAGNYGTTTN